MPNRTQAPQQPGQGGRNPMQTSPDDDEAQVGDQTHLDGQQQPRRLRRPDHAGNCTVPLSADRAAEA